MIKIDELLAQMTMEQQVKFAIYCTMEVSDNPKFRKWAKNWVCGKNRSIKSAQTVRSTEWSIARLAERSPRLSAISKLVRLTCLMASEYKDHVLWDPKYIIIVIKLAKRAKPNIAFERWGKKALKG